MTHPGNEVPEPKEALPTKMHDMSRVQGVGSLRFGVVVYVDLLLARRFAVLVIHISRVEGSGYVFDSIPASRSR